MSLSETEKARGWAEFRCKEHGFLVATSAWALVTCRCGKPAKPYRGRRALRAAEREALRKA
jgi:hypothetical protein